VLSAEVKQALRAEAERLDDGGDDVAIVRAVGDAFAALDTELERIAKVRRRAVRRLRRQGWSYDRIAEATGLSKGRVAQLSKDLRHR
jgi:DNA-directed RNA polymerase specialized sigma24 family protein